MSDKMKLILKVRTQMVESIVESSYISAHYWTQGSRSSTTDQHTSTLTIHNCEESAYSCVRLHDMKTDMLCVVQSKVQPQMGLASVT